MVLWNSSVECLNAVICFQKWTQRRACWYYVGIIRIGTRCCPCEHVGTVLYEFRWSPPVGFGRASELPPWCSVACSRVPVLCNDLALALTILLNACQQCAFNGSYPPPRLRCMYKNNAPFLLFSTCAFLMCLLFRVLWGCL